MPSTRLSIVARLASCGGVPSDDSGCLMEWLACHHKRDVDRKQRSSEYHNKDRESLAEARCWEPLCELRAK